MTIRTEMIENMELTGEFSFHQLSKKLMGRRCNCCGEEVDGQESGGRDDGGVGIFRLDFADEVRWSACGSVDRDRWKFVGP